MPIYGTHHVIRGDRKTHKLLVGHFDSNACKLLEGHVYAEQGLYSLYE